MKEEQSYRAIGVLELTGLAAAKMADAWRLVVITALQDAQGLELSYTFEKAQRLESLRLRLPLDDARVPSITGSYLAAFTYENELQDLFGIKVEGLAIDFKGEFYMKKRPNPFLKQAVSAAGGDGG